MLDPEYVKSRIRTVPDWPKKGIMFRDITTLLKDPQAFRQVIQVLYERYKTERPDLVVGIEARGFIIGGALAHELNCGFIPLRKKGKLPYRTVSEEYDLEYGKDSIEMHVDAISAGQRIVLVDDLIATGGTALAACRLIGKLGGNVIECAFLVDLPDLGGKKKLENAGYKAYALVEFEGE